MVRQARVRGPASRPCPASSFRSPAISSAVSAEIAPGGVFGRRDRRSNAASPWLSPSIVTAVMTSRAFDVRTHCRPAHSYALRHPILMS